MRALLPLALLTACESRPPDALDCDTPAEITGTVDAGDPEAIHRTDVLVTGTASSDRLAIRTLRLGSFPVASASGDANFATWSATLPITSLIPLAVDRGDGTGDVALDPVATDSCGVEHPFPAPADMRVDLTPTVSVGTLTLTVAVPDGLGFLPANGSVPAALELTSGPDAAGAPVTVTTSAGVLTPADGVVWLGGDGLTNATGRLLFAGSGSGTTTALITATTDGADATAQVQLVGSPTVFPSTAEVAPGAQIAVEVSSDGELGQCWWTAPNATDFVVAYGGTTPADGLVVFPAGMTAAELTLTAAQAPSGSTALDLQCCDVFLQCLTDPAVFSTAPTP